MKRGRLLAVTLGLSGAAGVVLSAGASAQVVEVTTLMSGLHMTPQVEYSTMVLTVSGNGSVWRHEYAAGEMIRLDLVDGSGQALSDGVYKWELSAQPKTRIDRSTEDGTAVAVRAAATRGSATQSGTFGIAGGALVTPDKTEPEAREISGPGLSMRDQVILDDLIVDGSICAGFDCVNGESFGFDTLRLKENNLRIKFQDTSNSASFPTRDWQITANDTSNGGQEKFSIDDIDGGLTPFTIEAGAPSHSLYVDDGGNIGMGTSTPVVQLHVKDGNTPTLRLEQDGSSGFTAQTWDVAGNEANFFVRDVTNGSTLPFRVFPGAPSNSLNIEGGTGDVGLGTTAPAAPLHIRRTNGTARVQIEEASGAVANRTLLSLENNGAVTVNYTNTSSGVSWGLNALGGGFAISLVGSGTNEFLVTPTGNVEVPQGTVVHTSSRTLKHDIQPVDPLQVLTKVASLPVASWRYNRSAQDMHMGPMAEDFYEAFGLGNDEKAIALSDTGGVALAAIQGLNLMVRTLETENATLAARVAALESLLSAKADTGGQ